VYHVASFNWIKIFNLVYIIITFRKPEVGWRQPTAPEELYTPLLKWVWPRLWRSCLPRGDGEADSFKSAKDRVSGDIEVLSTDDGYNNDDYNVHDGDDDDNF